MVPSDDDRYRAGLGRLPDELTNRRHAAFDAEAINRRVAVVHDLKDLLPRHPDMHVRQTASVQETQTRTEGVGPSASPAHTDPHVHLCPEDGDVHLAGTKVLGSERNGKLKECQDA